ncbi:hypothetical protein L596_011715 [Steinernema carpocapsae]|uniref:Uncharacterized protein n=1 Tax=Steinernema carpocapsae TaxID=34508 RepID=A0A4U5NUX0_STECR|nr:hypothetical protein L596_011715 [Steinernema carpocapsae]
MHANANGAATVTRVRSIKQLASRNFVTDGQRDGRTRLDRSSLFYKGCLSPRTILAERVLSLGFVFIRSVLSQRYFRPSARIRLADLFFAGFSRITTHA